MNYEYADRAIRQINRRNLRLFEKIRALAFDALNIIQTVKSVYSESYNYARKKYLGVAWDAFYEAMIEAGKDVDTAKTQADKHIKPDWILDMLEEYDPVTLYRFKPEMERKRQRLSEALIASHNKSTEVDKALRYWTTQCSHYALKSADQGTIYGYKSAGITKVQWIAENDEKTCDECWQRNGVIYDIDDVPVKPHYLCRCRLRPVKG